MTNAIHYLRTIIVCLIAALVPLTLFGCKEHAQPLQPQELEALFARWFVNPASQRFDSLAAAGLSCSQLEAMVAEIKSESSPAGICTTSLVDSLGTPYAMGYQTPRTVDPAKKYPLVIYLHGGIGTSMNNKGERAWDMLAALGDSMELFLASPSASRTTPWWTPIGLSRILQTIRFLSLKYPIDPNKVFLAGVSDGAAGCYAAANTIPHPFAGFFAISGYGGMVEQFGMRLVPGNLMQRPLYEVHAGQDHLYPLKIVTTFLDKMEKLGVPITRKIYPKEKHGFDYRDKEMGALAGFIRSWSKPLDRRGINWVYTEGFPNAADNIISILLIQEHLSAPTISGFWKNDTLMLHTTSARELTITVPGATGSILVKINDGNPEHISPRTDDRNALLHSMLHGCTPTSICGPFYTIPIRE